MKRPEKQDNEAVSEYFSGYNQASKDWEEFLPSIDELHNIIDDYTGISGQIIRKIAIAISRRIRDEKSTPV